MARPAVLRLEIHLQPRASRNRIVGRQGGALKVQVHAPPVGGAANDALLELLAATLHLPRRTLRIARGESSRNKLVEVHSADSDACLQLIEAAIQTTAPR